MPEKPEVEQNQTQVPLENIFNDPPPSTEPEFNPFDLPPPSE